jgi:hypothetical protein
MLYAPYLVFRSHIRRKEMQKGQIGYGIALRRFCGLRVNVLQPSGAKHFNILSSRIVILLVPILLFRSVGGHGVITLNRSGKLCVWFKVLAITSLGGTNHARRFRPYDGQNGRLRFVVEKSLDGVLAITPRTSRAPLLPAEAERLWGPKGAGRIHHCMPNSLHTL